jgi:hypothetical protein
MKVQQYSEKSVVLISENEKEIEYIKLQKQVLKNLFGKFNPFLSCGPAWVFSSKRAVLEYLFLGSQTMKEVRLLSYTAFIWAWTLSFVY